MQTLPNTNLPDVQSSADPRNIAIDFVGVRGLELPVTVESANGVQPTVAEIGMFVSLPAHQKGTHMSRFLGLLKEHATPLNRQTLTELMQSMLSALEAESGRIDFEFPFFVQKHAPISELESLMNYRVKLSVEHKAGRTLVTQTVTAPVTSLCPCSKEISRYGAHNQRSHITIAARLCGDLSLEEQIRFAEESASCELWSRLKRVDEKYVTESAYENPKFVEDLVRDVAGRVNADPRIEAYRVEAENFESIHNHSAYAQIFKGDL